MKRECKLPGFENVWVKFKERGFTFGKRREWSEINSDPAALEFLLPFVEEWNVPDQDGGAVPVSLAGLDNVEDRLVVWLIGEFGAHWRELITPPKNS